MRLILILIFTCQLTYSKAGSTSVDNRSGSAGEIANIHLPILGDRAETIGNFKINFDKMPGGQATDSFIMNSISLGLGSRVEVGIIPWVYTSGNEGTFKYGATVKYNFYRGREFQLAIGGSQIKLSMNDNKNEQDKDGYGSDYAMRFEQYWNYQFLSLNYTPLDKRYNMGLTFKYTEIKSTSSVKGSYAYEYDSKKVDYPLSESSEDSSHSSTLTFDMNYQLKSFNWVGFALGTGSLGSRLNIDESVDDEMEYNSRIRYVLGGSYIYRKKLGFLDTPRLSVLLFEGDGIQFGFSTFI